MDGHVAESSSSREKPGESEERLRKKTKQPKERNYGVNNQILFSSWIISYVVDNFHYRRRTQKQQQLIQHNLNRRLQDGSEATQKRLMRMKNGRYWSMVQSTLSNFSFRSLFVCLLLWWRSSLLVSTLLRMFIWSTRHSTKHPVIQASKYGMLLATVS